MIPKKNRIHKSTDFSKIFSSGKVVYSKNFSINFDFEIDDLSIDRFPQIAVVTSKKVSNRAHIRNKIRRQVYSTIRDTYIYQENKGVRLIIVCKNPLVNMEFDEVEQDLKDLLTRIRF